MRLTIFAAAGGIGQQLVEQPTGSWLAAAQRFGNRMVNPRRILASRSRPSTAVFASMPSPSDPVFHLD